MLRWCSKLRRSRLIYALVLATVFTIASLGVAQRVGMQSFAQNAPAVRHVAIIINKSQLIRFDRPIKTATIASTAIADVTPMTDRSLYIQGKSIGTTNISVFDENMQLAEIVDLEVTYDVKSLQDKIRESTGNNAIKVSTSNGEIILNGMANNAVAADRAVSVAQSMVKGVAVVNAMSVAPSQQVMLEVRFLEASRSAERDLGVNWFGTNAAGTRGFSTGLGSPSIAGTTSTTSSGSGVGTGSGTVTTSTSGTGGISVIQSAGALLSTSGAAPFGVMIANLANNGSGNLNVMVSALEEQGLVRRLAEPNLVTLSGETAKFLAGGSFPIPTISSTTTGATTPTFQMQPYGISLLSFPLC